MQSTVPPELAAAVLPEATAASAAAPAGVGVHGLGLGLFPRMSSGALWTTAWAAAAAATAAAAANPTSREGSLLPLPPPLPLMALMPFMPLALPPGVSPRAALPNPDPPEPQVRPFTLRRAAGVAGDAAAPRGGAPHPVRGPALGVRQLNGLSQQQALYGQLGNGDAAGGDGDGGGGDAGYDARRSDMSGADGSGVAPTSVGPSTTACCTLTPATAPPPTPSLAARNQAPHAEAAATAEADPAGGGGAGGSQGVPVIWQPLNASEQPPQPQPSLQLPASPQLPSPQPPPPQSQRQLMLVSRKAASAAAEPPILQTGSPAAQNAAVVHLWPRHPTATEATLETGPLDTIMAQAAAPTAPWLGAGRMTSVGRVIAPAGATVTAATRQLAAQLQSVHLTRQMTTLTDLNNNIHCNLPRDVVHVLQQLQQVQCQQLQKLTDHQLQLEQKQLQQKQKQQPQPQPPQPEEELQQHRHRHRHRHQQQHRQQHIEYSRDARPVRQPRAQLPPPQTAAAAAGSHAPRSRFRRPSFESVSEFAMPQYDNDDPRGALLRSPSLVPLLPKPSLMPQQRPRQLPNGSATMRPASPTDATPGSVPIFRATRPSLRNQCAQCGTFDTGGCWRKGWVISLPGERSFANLCNRCGLRYQRHLHNQCMAALAAANGDGDAGTAAAAAATATAATATAAAAAATTFSPGAPGGSASDNINISGVASDPKCGAKPAASRVRRRGGIDVDNGDFGAGISGCGRSGRNGGEVDGRDKDDDGGRETSFPCMQPRASALVGSNITLPVPLGAATAATAAAATADVASGALARAPWVNAAGKGRKRVRTCPQSASADAAHEDSWTAADGGKRPLLGWPPTPPSLHMLRAMSEPHSWGPHGSAPLRTTQPRPTQQPAVAPIAEPQWDVPHVPRTKSKRHAIPNMAVAAPVAAVAPGHDTAMEALLSATARAQARYVAPANAPAAAAAPPQVVTTAMAALASVAIPPSGTGTGRNAEGPPQLVVRMKLRRPTALMQPQSQLHRAIPPLMPMPAQSLQLLHYPERKRTAPGREGSDQQRRIASGQKATGNEAAGVPVIEPQSVVTSSGVCCNGSDGGGGSGGVGHAADGDAADGGSGGFGGSPPPRQYLQYDNETERRGSGSVHCTTISTETDHDGGEIGGGIRPSTIRCKRSNTQFRLSSAPCQTMPHRFIGTDLDTAVRQTLGKLNDFHMTNQMLYPPLRIAFDGMAVVPAVQAADAVAVGAVAPPPPPLLASWVVSIPPAVQVVSVPLSVAATLPLLQDVALTAKATSDNGATAAAAAVRGDVAAPPCQEPSSSAFAAEVGDYREYSDAAAAAEVGVIKGAQPRSTRAVTPSLPSASAAVADARRCISWTPLAQRVHPISAKLYDKSNSDPDFDPKGLKLTDRRVRGTPQARAPKRLPAFDAAEALLMLGGTACQRPTAIDVDDIGDDGGGCGGGQATEEEEAGEFQVAYNAQQVQV